MKTIIREDEELKIAAQILLEHYWIVRDKNPNEFDLIKKYEPKLRLWFRDKAGFELVVHRKLFAKLEKIPASPSEHMTLDPDTFKRPMDYAIFFCLLSFFESHYDKAFLISEYCEHMLATFGEKEQFLKNYPNRLSLIRIFKYAVKMGILIHRDGDLEHFENEVLYKVPQLARYFVRPFSCSVKEGLADYNVWLYNSKLIGHSHRNMYRKLLLEPVFLFSENETEDIEYAKKQRLIIEKDIAVHTPFQIEFFKEGLITVRDESEGRMVSDYPSDTPISDIVLQLAEILKIRYLQSEIEPEDNGCYIVSRLEWEECLIGIKSEVGEYWSQHYSTLSHNKLIQEIEDYLISWKMLHVSNKHTVSIAPHMLRITGKITSRGEKLHEMVTQPGSTN